MSRLAPKPMQTEGFQLLRAAEVCAKAVVEYGYEDASQRERVSLHLAGDFVFRGDETAFLFVLFNLIKNALAYPRLTVRIQVESGRVRVMDNGPGMAPQVLARLFEPFQTSGKKGGTGLGLAYCQRVMAAFGGGIGCESVRGEYTCFTLTFPPVTQAENDAVQNAAVAQARRALQGRRLLLVDDEKALRVATQRTLMSTGAIVDECANGEEALAMLAANRYDLVILDLNMPRLDGYSTTERIRAGHEGIDRGLRIVAHSSEPAALTRVKTRKAGMNGFIAKPSEQTVLLHTLCQVMESPTIESSMASESSLRGKVVLLVDDNAYNRRAVAAYLRDGGATVVEADSGPQALSLLEDMERCSAILMDIEMPGMDGLETARAVRASGMACQGAPILALTAHSGADISKAVRDAGMNDMLLKPVDKARLFARLQGLDVQPVTPPVVEASLPAGFLVLDVPRLESHRRVGVLEELVRGYWTDVERLLGEVETAANAGDLKACSRAMHSLVGMSGEACARALFARARGFYMPMAEEGHWPEQPDWVSELRALAVDADRALRAYVG